MIKYRRLNTLSKGKDPSKEFPIGAEKVGQKYPKLRSVFNPSRAGLFRNMAPIGHKKCMVRKYKHKFEIREFYKVGYRSIISQNPFLKLRIHKL